MNINDEIAVSPKADKLQLEGAPAASMAAASVQAWAATESSDHSRISTANESVLPKLRLDLTGNPIHNTDAAKLQQRPEPVILAEAGSIVHAEKGMKVYAKTGSTVYAESGVPYLLQKEFQSMWEASQSAPPLHLAPDQGSGMENDFLPEPVTKLPPAWSSYQRSNFQHQNH